MKRSYIIAAILTLLAAGAWGNAARADVLTKRLGMTVGREWTAESDEDALQASIAGKILRFHIMANSDSEEDQNVKALVRDEVGRRLEPLLQDAENRDETETIVREHMDEVVRTADAVLEENGFSYGAKAELVTAEFPVKTYGSFTFPAGEYRALEITLGAGCGHNWWCVLYPNMCFQGTVYEVKDEKNGKVLREVLSPKEYKKVFNSKNYKIRWKFLEYFR